MRVTVLLFAAPKELVGEPSVSIEVLPQTSTSTCTVSALRQELSKTYPALQAILPACRIAINQNFAEDGDYIEESSEVALIPPVSGG